jgi:hypothetical protein
MYNVTSGKKATTPLMMINMCEYVWYIICSRLPHFVLDATLDM